MKFEDTLAWPPIPVPRIPRAEVETLYSLGHYDGPMTGLARWKGRLCYLSGFEYCGTRCYWVIALTDEQATALLQRAERWAERYGLNMSWTPDGQAKPYARGNAINVWGPDTFDNPWRKRFESEVPPQPDLSGADVLGYISGWSMYDANEDEDSEAER
jgi:hypothetical protein